MVREMKTLHHRHIRKKEHKSSLHQKGFKRFVDKIIYPVAILGPIMTFPQVYNVWFLKEASGVSVTSWFSYAILSIVWLMYGLLHKEKPIIITSVIWIILDLLIVLGVVLH